MSNPQCGHLDKIVTEDQPFLEFGAEKHAARVSLFLVLHAHGNVVGHDPEEIVHHPGGALWPIEMDVPLRRRHPDSVQKGAKLKAMVRMHMCQQYSVDIGKRIAGFNELPRHSEATIDDIGASRKFDHGRGRPTGAGAQSRPTLGSQQYNPVTHIEFFTSMVLSGHSC